MSTVRRTPRTPPSRSQPSMGAPATRRSRRSSLVGALAAVLVGLAVGHGNVAAQSPDVAVAWMLSASQRLTTPHQSVTYEVGEAVVYHQAPSETSLSVTTSIARSGDRAGTVLLLPSDPQYRGSLGFRSEWQSEFLAEAGNEYSYGASYYLPADWNQGVNPRTFDDRIIFQFHEGNGKSPTFSLHLDAANERIFVRNRRPNGVFDALWSTELEIERWYDFAFRVHWSRDNDGFFQIYLDGRLQYEYTGQTLNDSNRV